MDNILNKEVSTIKNMMSQPQSLVCGLGSSRNTSVYEQLIKATDPSQLKTIGRKPFDNCTARLDLSNSSRLTKLRDYGERGISASLDMYLQNLQNQIQMLLKSIRTSQIKIPIPGGCHLEITNGMRYHEMK